MDSKHLTLLSRYQRRRKLIANRRRTTSVKPKRAKGKTVSLLLDRLVGYDTLADDDEKLPIHQFVDAIYLNQSGFPQAPTNAEIVSAFSLSGPEAADALLLISLVTGGTRSVRDIEAILRLAERYRTVLTKSRVLALLGL